MQGHANLMVPYHLHVFMGISDWAGLQELSQLNYPSTSVVLYYVHTTSTLMGVLLYSLCQHQRDVTSQHTHDDHHKV